MKLGLIGTGMMGTQLAIRLAKRGHEVIVFNRDRSKAQIVHRSIGDNKIRIAHTPGEVGNNSKIVIVCVKDHQAIMDISTAKGGAGLTESSGRNRPNKSFINSMQYNISHRIPSCGMSLRQQEYQCDYCANYRRY